MFYLIKQLSVQKAIKIRSIWLASTPATLEPIDEIVPIEVMLHRYDRSVGLYHITLPNLFPVMSSEDKAQLEKVLPLCQKIYDSYKETVLPHLYKGAVEFNCVSSWDIYLQLKRFIPRMLNGKAVAINQPTFSLCSDLNHDDKVLTLVYTSKGSRKRITFALNIAEKRFDVQSYPAELDTTEDGCVVIPGKTILADICKMLQMPIWSFNDYVNSYYGKNNSNWPFYMNHDLVQHDLPDSILDLPIIDYSKTFTFASLYRLLKEIYKRQQAMN